VAQKPSCHYIIASLRTASLHTGAETLEISRSALEEELGVLRLLATTSYSTLG
jgi:hypothetical protein